MSASTSARAVTSRSRELAVLLATPLWSLVTAVLGLWWLLAPSGYVLDGSTTDEPLSLMTVLAPSAGAVLILLLGLTGTVLAIWLGRARPGTRWRGPLLAAGAAYAVFLAVAVPDLQVLIVLGYALALFGGPILLVILLIGARRHPSNVLLLLAIAMAVAAGIVAGEVGSETLQVLDGVAEGVSRVGVRPLVLLFMLAGGVLFGLSTAAAARRTAPGSLPNGRVVGRSEGTDQLQRWGRRATVVAALCPVPYGLLRMTWATPWPLFTGPVDLDSEPGLRAFGLCLGLAALAGGWLSLGLIRRWGEVWPAWLPGLRGRPVNVWAAVLPASAVALVLCASAVSMLVLAVGEAEWWLVLVIPTPIWGPALALATYAYHRRRLHPGGGSHGQRDPTETGSRGPMRHPR